MIDRIKKIMSHYGYTSTQFADRIGAQRSAMSHVLSGRNKPSLDFVTKIKHAFPEISLDWLVLGKGGMFTSGAPRDENGNFLPQDEPEQTRLPFDSIAEQESIPKQNTPSGDKEEEEAVPMVKSEEPPEYRTRQTESADNNGKSQPELIVFYYSDGTFKSYRSR